jgi:hypothetical protein
LTYTEKAADGSRQFLNEFIDVRFRGFFYHKITYGGTGSVTGTVRFKLRDHAALRMNTGDLTTVAGDTAGSIINGAVFVGETVTVHAPDTVGVADTARFSQTSTGLMTVRNDSAGIPLPLTIQNFGIAGVDQGGSVRFTFGAGGTSGGTAAEMSSLSTENWSVAANRSAKYRFNVRTDDTLVAELDISQGIRVRPTTSVPAGGATSLGVKATDTTNFGVFFGSGAPTLAAAKGSLYLRSDGTTTNNRAYIATDSAGTWTAITTVA